MKTLWLAEVEHKSVPGTMLVLCYREKEPSDQLVKRLTGHSPKGDLDVTAIFDLSHSLKNNEGNRRALAEFIADGGMS